MSGAAVSFPYRFLGRQLLREARGSRRRALFFSACLGLGVAAIVATSGLTSSIDAGLRAQARPLLGGDVAAESYRPLPAALLAEGRTFPGADRVETAEMPTVVTTGGTAEEPGKSQLVELKAVSGPYPLFGALAVEPPRPLAEIDAELKGVTDRILTMIGGLTK